MKYIAVFITTSSEKEARKIADGLIDSKSAACVNIVPNITSVFEWGGKREVAQECLLIAKTTDERFGRLRDKTKELHSYDVPEIISVPIAKGNREYLRWISGLLA